MRAAGNSFIAVVLLILLTGTVCWSQATAQISGTVRDQSGAVLPGVDIAATQINTGIVRNTVTDETGAYVLQNLALGPYRLEAALPGFRTFVQTGIVLQVNTNPVFNVILQLGQVTETVEVQANAAMVETRNVGVGNVIENERILELPLNGRLATDLIVLAGAAVETAGVNITRSMQNIPAISVAGGLTSGLTYVLDGAIHNDPTNNLSLPFPFPDSLQEFNVQTSALSAEKGMHSAGSVSAVTKSGTNDVHGDLFEFVRNDLFNARRYFATQKSTLKRNQFGGTLGGPIVQNKLFFFGGYQRTTTRQDPADLVAFVPTAAMLAGDWTTFASPSCNGGRQITLAAPFVNNQIDPTLYSKAAISIAKQLPKTANPCGRTTYGYRTVLNENQFVGRIDYQHSARHSMFGRYLATKYDNPPPYNVDPGKNLLNTSASGYDNLAQSLTLGWTDLINPTTIYSLRFAGNRTAVLRSGPSFFSAAEVGVDAYSYVPKIMILNVTGGFALGCGSCQPLMSKTNTYQITSDVSLVRGRNQFSFGGSLASWKEAFLANAQSLGTYTFTGQATGLGMSDFIAGRLTTFTQSPPNPYNVRGWNGGIYGQNVWNPTRRLTVSTGLRWDPYLPTRFTNGNIYNFDYDRFRQGIKSTVFKNAPAGLYYPGDTGFPGNAGIHDQWMHFAPRVGLAWDVNGSGNTSIRASYGIAYDFAPTEAFLASVSFAPPWTITTTLISPPGGLDAPWQGFPGGNPFPVGPVSSDVNFLPFGRIDAMPYTLGTARSSSWNLSVQRQIASAWLISATYLGTLQTHVWRPTPANLAMYFPGAPVDGVCTSGDYVLRTTGAACSTTANTNQRRIFNLERPQDGQYFGSMTQFQSDGTGTYNGLLVAVERRALRNVTMHANYTWSHCINDPNVDPSPVLVPDPVTGTDRRFDRGNCNSDRRQIFNLTSVGETPQFSSPLMRALGSGWRLSGIYRRSTGRYISPVNGVDRALSGVGGQRPNLVLTNPYGNKSLTNYLNPAAFAQPALGTIGNLGRNRILGPSTWQFDLALSRIFNLHEAQRLELRAEAFNVTNSLRKQDPDTNLTSNTFGQITASADPRILQFALKYLF